MTASSATTIWISGPVLRARPDGAFLLREAVTVGEARLLGEVIRVAREEITVQVYEDTSGLRPGAPVTGSGRLLSIRLGPGMLGRIFDGLLRPIGRPDTEHPAARADAGADRGGADRGAGGADPASDPYVQPGMRDETPGRFRFVPRVAVGERLGPGAVVGDVGPPGVAAPAVDGTGRATAEVLVGPDAAGPLCMAPDFGGAGSGAGVGAGAGAGADAALTQRCLVPPDYPAGRVIGIGADGVYGEDEPVCRLRADDGRELDIAMAHRWPVRRPRPVAERLASDEPMLTGQRIVDCLFPIARGGTAAIPGGFGTGKTVLLETIAKWCDADVIVYVGCGERGNELAGLLAEFSELIDPRSGRALLERTVVIANTSNMPVSAREASIYTGITVAEYFRDQGLDVALMADSTSRWAEALREVSGRLGELPGEAGYPAYLSSRLADFYERAARARTLAGSTGSVTVMGAVSPPSGDFSEPVTNHTRRYVGGLWTLDVRRAQARFYPAIHPLNSYSTSAAGLARWWHSEGCTRWEELRRRFLTLLEDEARLERMARIIGRDAMPARQRLVLLCAQLINHAFLRQSAFSTIDRYATPQRQAVMMRLLGSFFETAERLLAAGVVPETLAAEPIFRALLRMGEEIPDGDWERFSDLDRELTNTERRLLDAMAAAPA